jgi:hypothetical protein
MQSGYHDLFLQYGSTFSDKYSHLPLILVVGREPNNSAPFRPTIGNYPLEAQIYNGKKRTVAFWDQSYGTIGKTAGLSCPALKSVARRVDASPIVFTDVMPIPAIYTPGSNAPRKAREEADEDTIFAHHENIFSMREVIDRVTVVVLAGHRHGNFKVRERKMLGQATASFAKQCALQKPPIPTIETKAMFGNNQPWNLETISSNVEVTQLIKEAVNCLLEIDRKNKESFI